MSKDVFGTPDAGDATAEWDKVVEEAGREHAEMFDIAKQNVLNRQLGSKKVPPEEEIREYSLYRDIAMDDPSPLAKLLQARGESLEEMVNYAWALESKLRNG